MPQGQPSVVPKDGLTTRQRRNRPLVIVHTLLDVFAFVGYALLRDVIST